MHPRTFHFSMHSWRVTHSYFTTFHSHLFAYALLAFTCIHVSNPHSIADNFIIPQPTFYLHSHTYLHSCLLILILFSCKILIIFVFFWIFVFKKIGEKNRGKKQTKKLKKKFGKKPSFFFSKKRTQKNKMISAVHSYTSFTCMHVHSRAFICTCSPAQPSPVSWLSALTDVCKCFRMQWYENAWKNECLWMQTNAVCWLECNQMRTHRMCVNCV